MRLVEENQVVFAGYIREPFPIIGLRYAIRAASKIGFRFCKEEEGQILIGKIGRILSGIYPRTQFSQLVRGNTVSVPRFAGCQTETVLRDNRTDNDPSPV